MNNKEIIKPFFYQLATMIDAGLPLVEALQLTADSTDNEDIKKMSLDVKTMIELGKTFSEAMLRYPTLFDKYCVHMVYAGELGGILDTVLNRLATSIDWEIKLAHKMEKAFSTKIFADITYLKERLAVEINETESDKLFLKSTNIGQLFLTTEMIRFCRTLATLIACGVPILDSLEIVSDNANNQTVKKAILSVREKVTEGLSISKPFIDTELFPALFCNMMTIAEACGAMDVTLAKMADFYDDELDRRIEDLSGRNL